MKCHVSEVQNIEQNVRRSTSRQIIQKKDSIEQNKGLDINTKAAERVFPKITSD